MPKPKESIAPPPPPPPNPPNHDGCPLPEGEAMFGNLSHLHVPSYVRSDRIQDGPGRVLLPGSEVWIDHSSVPNDTWGFLLVYDCRTNGHPRVLAMTQVDLSEERISAFTTRKAPSAKVRAILLSSEVDLWRWARSQAFHGLIRGNEGAGGSTVLGDGNGECPSPVTP